MSEPRWNLLRFEGTISPRSYFLIGFSLTLLKQALDRLVASWAFGRPWSPLSYAVTGEIGGLFSLNRDDQIFYATMLALALPFLVVGVVLTVRRLRDAGWPLWLVLFFFAHADQHRLFHRAVSYAESGAHGSWNAGRRDRWTRGGEIRLEGDSAPLFLQEGDPGDLDSPAGRRGGGLFLHAHPSRLRLELVRRSSLRAADALGRDLWLPQRGERSATTESGAASGQRMPFPDYVSRPRARSDPVDPSGSCGSLSTPSSRTG